MDAQQRRKRARELGKSWPLNSKVRFKDSPVMFSDGEVNFWIVYGYTENKLKIRRKDFKAGYPVKPNDLTLIG